MSDSSPADASVSLTPLSADDAAAFWPWLRDQAHWHVAHWAERTHLGWDEADVTARVRDGRLVEKEWVELLAAAESDTALVRVLRVDGVARGGVYCEIRTDRYLGLPMGVLSWLHVDPSMRGRGLSEPLVAAALGWFARRGVPVAEVNVTAVNEAAVRAYARSGFEIVDHRMLVGIRAG